MTEHKDNSKYIWGQFLFTKKKKKMLYWEEGKHATPVYFDAALWPKSEHSLRQRGKRGREGGATCRGSTHSTHVSTLVIFHYIFKSRVRWVGETDRQTERERGTRDEWGEEKRGMLGGRESRGKMMSYCSLCSWSFIHHNSLVCATMWARACVFVHERNILDKASVRCHISETPLFMYPTNMCHKVWERAQGFGD